MKQKRMMLMLGGVLVVLIGCYVGLKAWNDHQQEQAEADEEAAKIRQRFLTRTERVRWDLHWRKTHGAIRRIRKSR